jgi:hypothetical protein
MSERDKVWTIASGEYSDYRVHCACPSKEDADLLASRLNATRNSGYYDDFVVEELPVCDRDTQQVTVLYLTTTLWDNGTESDSGERLNTVWPFDYDESARLAVTWRWVRAPMHHHTGGRLDVSGTDHERVRKVFSDRRAELLSDLALRKVPERAGSRP